MSSKKVKFYLILFFLISILSCYRKNNISVRIGKFNKKVIVKNMNEKLVISLSSYKKAPITVSVVVHNLTDDVSDMPIYKNMYTVYSGVNYLIINLKDIGVGKYSLRIYYDKEIIDYRIIEITRKKIK